MNVLVNQETLCAVLTPTSDRSELIALLQAIIDEELENEEMDTDLVDECILAIADLEGNPSPQVPGSFQALINYCHSKAFKKSMRLKRTALIAAVVVIAASITLLASPALAKQTKDWISSIITNIVAAADSTDMGKSEIVSIYALPKEGVSFTARSESEIVPDHFDIIAVDENNIETPVSLSACKVQKEPLDSRHIMLTFSYEGCAYSVIYQLEDEE